MNHCDQPILQIANFDYGLYSYPLLKKPGRSFCISKESIPCLKSKYASQDIQCWGFLIIFWFFSSLQWWHYMSSLLYLPFIVALVSNMFESHSTYNRLLARGSSSMNFCICLRSSLISSLVLPRLASSCLTTFKLWNISTSLTSFRWMCCWVAKGPIEWLFTFVKKQIKPTNQTPTSKNNQESTTYNLQTTKYNLQSESETEPTIGE